MSVPNRTVVWCEEEGVTADAPTIALKDCRIACGGCGVSRQLPRPYRTVAWLANVVVASKKQPWNYKSVAWFDRRLW